MSVGEEQFLMQVMKHLFKTRGIDISGYSESFVMRAIKKRVGRTYSPDNSDYLKTLLQSEAETNELLGALSINVTEFFRDKGVFEAFEKKVIGPLLESKIQEGALLRIWSAGCATGQETYTIAMCLAEEVRNHKPCKIPLMSILGTDISKIALVKAESGIYQREEVKGIPEKLLNRYFVRKGHTYEAAPSLTKYVRFARENLLEKPGSKFFDVIVCRNVLIYFNRDMHEIVVQNLYESLRKGGYLMLGRTETLMGAPRSAFEVVDLENRILKKL
jgi:chemotaxis methyl-accepting protein methylase